jgi:hypothetical protein
MKAEHRYGVGSVRSDRLTCACGHVELFNGDAELPAALERLNAHIRGTYTDEEWEELMKKCKVALVDGTTGAVTLPPEGDKA